MNEEQYRFLCKICDSVLLASDSAIERVAIPWLHVIREHPVFLSNYVDIFEFSNGGRAIVRRLWRSLHNRAVWLRQIARSLRSDSKPWYGAEYLPSGIDVVFISHLLNSSQAGQEEDFYFGSLPNQLIACGYNVVIALINHSGQCPACLSAKWEGSLVPRVILSDSLRFCEEIALHQRLKKESLRLGKLAKKEASGLLRRVLARASEEGLTNGSLTNMRMFSQIGLLTAKLQPKAIVVTHEGHAWERIVFAASRSVSPNVYCIGYQHAALFRLQHAIRRNLTQEYNPDQILTSGTIGKSQMECAPDLNGLPIYVLGSNRYFKRSNINSVMGADQSRQSDNSACMVLPEGITSECHLLFEFSLECAQNLPEVQFIWRLHPLVTFKSLLAQNPKLRDLPKNIVLSQATLEEDIARCRWALYRGTTAVIQAVVAGLCPIYLKLPSEMTIDPLYELKDWRFTVASVSEFQDVINTGINVNFCSSKSKAQTAIKYCEDFFLPFDPKVLIDTILNKKPTHEGAKTWLAI